MAGEGTYELAEHHATHCHWEALHPHDDYEGGCDGGSIWMVTNLYSTQGAALEDCDPYTYDDETCHTTCPLTKTVTDMWALGGASAPPTSTLKSWLYNYGPLYVAMYAGYDDGWAYEFSHYDGSYTLHYPTEPLYLNHAVLLVGWDDTLAHDGGTGGWIVKNSWGTGWGDGGYFTIAYGSAGIGGWAALIKGWQDYEPDGSLLYLDEAGMQTFVGILGSNEAWGLARLTPGEDGCATQVEIWTSDATDVDVYIYDDFDSDAASGLLWSSMDKTFDYPGYHGVSIQPPLPLTAGDDVHVVVKVVNADSGFPLAVDNLEPLSDDRSYASDDGEDWVNLYSYGWDLGIRLRAGPCVECNVHLPVVLKEWARATLP